MASTTSVRPRQANQPVFTRPRKQLPFPLGLYQTSVGKKWVMAVTGIMLLGFVLTHMIGNLHLYQGPAGVNEYAEQLRTLGGHLLPRSGALWLLRLGLLGATILHVHSAITLTAINRKARPTGYKSDRNFLAANFASRSMRYTGAIVLLYVIFHLCDLTWGLLLGDDYITGDVYNNVSRSLSSVPVAIIYIVANVVLAVHIFHGAWSMFQSLGLNNPKFATARRRFAQGFAGLILIGNLSFPIAAQAKVFDQDHRQTECADGSQTCLTMSEGSHK